MQQHFLFAAVGAFSAVCLTVLDRVDTLASRIDSASYQTSGQLLPIRPAGPRLLALRPPSLPNLIDSVSAANQFFVSQYRSSFNPTANTANADCGPACLAMAMKRFYAGKVAGSDAAELVRLARVAMTGDSDELVTTDNDDVIKGAALLGLRARRAGDLQSLDQALDAGAMAVVSGSPSVPGCFGNRLSYHHCKSGHFIVIAGRSADHYLMCDPESPVGTAEITRAELQAFMSFWSPNHRALHGGIALWPAGSAGIAQLQPAQM